ncbi:MAG TPA: thermonuclease family protein [Thermoanaerobaculia bacterium]|nr:thermonuclease family protein [Thermoanaerobaculia bacterium]
METHHLVLGALLAVFQPPPTPDLELLLVDEEVFRGRVIRILSGDTVEVSRAEGSVRVRLRGVGGLPEEHPRHAAAVALLSRLLLEAVVEVRAVPDPASSEPDHLVATVLVAGASASQELLASGLAVYCPPPGGDQALEAAQVSARDQGRGIWSRGSKAPPLADGSDPCKA